MIFVTHLVIGFSMSFIGSLPPGMINFTAASTVIQKGLKASLLFALGAAMVEFFQAFLVIEFSTWFTSNPEVSEVIQIVAIPILFVLAFYFFYLARQSSTVKSNERELPDFVKGIVISLLNVLVIPYWLFYGTYFGANGWIILETKFTFTLSLGVMAGTFVLLLVYIGLARLLTKRIQKISRITNVVLGILFLILGSLQLANWLLS